MQEIIVAAIVAYAAWAVVLRYAPKAVRRNAGRALGAALNGVGLRRAADFIAKDTPQSDCASGCSNCSGCASSEAAPSAKQFAIPVTALKKTAGQVHKAR